MMFYRLFWVNIAYIQIGVKLMSINEKLLNIQSQLRVPKDLYNKFGNYKYRSAESILEALKPLLSKHKATLIITDEVVQMGDRYYIKAVAKLIDTEDGNSIEVSAYAREDESKKGMDSSQLTGSTSSYARKYALNGLFAIDDNKDSDSDEPDRREEKVDVRQESRGTISDAQIKRLFAIAYAANIDAATVREQIKAKFDKEVSELTRQEYDQVTKGYESLKE